MIKQCYQCRYFLGDTKNDIGNIWVLCAKKGKLTLNNDCDAVICMDFQVADKSTDTCKNCVNSNGTVPKEHLSTYDLIEELTYNLNGVQACLVGNAIKHLYNYNQTQVASELEAAIDILNECVNAIRGKHNEKEH